MLRLAAVLAREACAFVLAAAAAHVWCALAFLFLGFAPSETAALVFPAVLLSAVAVLDRCAARLFRRARRMGASGAAGMGFFVWALIGAAWLHLIGERAFASGNAADIALAGLVLGMPSGLFAWKAGNAARNSVDACFRIL